MWNVNQATAIDVLTQAGLISSTWRRGDAMAGRITLFGNLRRRNEALQRTYTDSRFSEFPVTPGTPVQAG